MHIPISSWKVGEVGVISWTSPPLLYQVYIARLYFYFSAAAFPGAFSALKAFGEMALENVFNVAGWLGLCGVCVTAKYSFGCEWLFSDALCLYRINCLCFSVGFLNFNDETKNGSN